MHFVQKVSTWAKHFRPFGKRFLTGTLEGHLMRPFKHLEIFWVTLRKIREQTEKKSKTSKNFVTWGKNFGSTVFRQGCWNCNLCVHLNNLKPSEFKTFANFFGTMSKKLFGLRKTLLALILKLHFFPQEKVLKNLLCIELCALFFRNFKN